jgi:hypothetical protein
MTTIKRSSKDATVGALVASDPDLMKALMKALMKQALPECLAVGRVRNPRTGLPGENTATKSDHRYQ